MGCIGRNDAEFATSTDQVRHNITPTGKTNELNSPALSQKLRAKIARPFTFY